MTPRCIALVFLFVQCLLPLRSFAEEEKDPPATPGEEASGTGTTGESSSKPPAETIELPDESGSVKVQGVSMGPKEEGPGKIGRDSVRLAAVADRVERGKDARFELDGPASFLRDSSAQYVLYDDLDREVCRATLKIGDLEPEGDGSYRFGVPTSRAIRIAHVLRMSIVGPGDQRFEPSVLIHIEPHRKWDRWVSLIHAPYQGERWETLRKLGIRGGMAYRLHIDRMAVLKELGVPFYVENIAHRLLSRYHTEPNLWKSVVDAAMKAPAAHDRLVRVPSFSSRAFGGAYAVELKRHAKTYRDARPLFYSLASEPSVTRLSAAFDFDFHPEGLADFRRWLEREVYGTLAALNTSWMTSFKRWDEVMPMTTGEARLRQKDGVLNFAPWMDFRRFQDHVFSKVLLDGARLIRRVDPEASVGITGAMGPAAFGGWDWTMLSRSLDVVEAYDVGEARTLWRDLAPGKPALAMVPLGRDLETLQEARRVLWSTALEGGVRGALLWDEVPGPDGSRKRVLLDEKLQPATASSVLAPTLRELDGLLGLFLSRAHRAPSDVAVVYSPASVRLRWLYEAAHLHGDKWLEKWGGNTKAERMESPQARLRVSWAKLLSDLGLAWRFVSSDQVAEGVLRQDGFRAVVLPRTLCLSGREVAALKAFVTEGGLLVADAACGRFDEHGRIHDTAPFDKLFGIDTSREPSFPQEEHPLEGIRDASRGQQGSLLPEPVLVSLPPAYSDAPTWTSPAPNRCCEFRKSPVLVRRGAGKGTAVYLNLNLQDYCRWRLDPTRPRAKATRDALLRVAFGPLLDVGLLDPRNSTLPPCTEASWLQVGDGKDPVRVLAVRRNTQSRVHEVCGMKSNNRKIERSESIKLAFREKVWVSDLLTEKQHGQTALVEGVLDPVTPTLLVVSRVNPGKPAVTAPESVQVGEGLTLRVMPGRPGASHARAYGLRVTGPDGKERLLYARSSFSPTGVVELSVPLAANDPVGNWSFAIRDLVAAEITYITVKLRGVEDR